MKDDLRLQKEVLMEVFGCNVRVEEIGYGRNEHSVIVKCGCTYADHAVVSRKALPVHEDVGTAWWMLGQLAEEFECVAGTELDRFTHEDKVLCRIHYLSKTTTPRKVVEEDSHAAIAACKAALRFVRKVGR